MSGGIRGLQTRRGAAHLSLVGSTPTLSAIHSTFPAPQWWMRCAYPPYLSPPAPRSVHKRSASSLHSYGGLCFQNFMVLRRSPRAARNAG